MYIIGITGPTGAGKTTALDVIKNLGGIVIDCDEVYHNLLRKDESLIGDIENTFGKCRDSENQFSTRILGNRVYGDTVARKKLQDITFPVIIRQVDNIITSEDRNGTKLAGIDAFALFESGLNEICNATICITAPVEDRVKRIMSRDRITEEHARNRIESQHKDEWFIRNCDYTLYNSGDRQKFRDEAYKLIYDLFKYES